MYGARCKIGVIVPSLNNTLEPEFNRMVPADVAWKKLEMLSSGARIASARLWG